MAKVPSLTGSGGASQSASSTIVVFPSESLVTRPIRVRSAEGCFVCIWFVSGGGEAISSASQALSPGPVFGVVVVLLGGNVVKSSDFSPFLSTDCSPEPHAGQEVWKSTTVCSGLPSNPSEFAIVPFNSVASLAGFVASWFRVILRDYA